MKIRATLVRWLPVILNTSAALGLFLFAFWPFHRQANEVSARTRVITQELQSRAALLTQLPVQKQELDSLVVRLGAFRSSLWGTDQVDLAMRALEARGAAGNVVFWQLNPSVPTLLTLARARDSIAALNLALLPVEFECLGDFADVGRFLEREEQRPQFCQWKRLTLSPGEKRDDVRAHGEILLFLLPAGEAAVEVSGEAAAGDAGEDT